MKKIVFPLLIMLSSCTAYQIQTTVSSNVKSIDSEAGKIYQYDDSLVTISYNLWSNGGRVNFMIYNKTNSPLYIDWNKSNLIINGKSIDYWKDQAYAASFYQSASVTGKYYNTSTGVGVSIINKEKPALQIPPTSYITMNKFALNRLAQKDTSNKFIFRNYISISKNQDLSNPVFINNDFRIANFKNVRGALFDENLVMPDSFYTTYTPKSSAVIPIVIGLLCIVGLSVYIADSPH